MLKLAQERDIDNIINFCNDLIGTRIACYCLAYGFDKDFFTVWIDDEGGVINAIVAKFYDSCTVKLTAGYEFDELSQFISMVGCNSIMCSNNLGFSDYDLKKAYVFLGELSDFSSRHLGEEYYKQLYSLISEAIPGSFDNSKEAYLAWLSDFTYRQRRNLARSKGVVQNGELLSCVITSSESHKAAVLSGVACKPTARKSGLGKATVLSVVNELANEGKKAYVIALNESAEGFYEHIGFEYIHDIYLIKI